MLAQAAAEAAVSAVGHQLRLIALQLRARAHELDGAAELTDAIEACAVRLVLLSNALTARATVALLR